MAGDDDTLDDEGGEAPARPILAGPRVDIYASYSEQDVDRILEFLEEEGIEALTRDHTSTPFPTNIGTTAEIVIAVRASEADRGREIIRQAVADEVISADGRFIEPPPPG